MADFDTAPDSPVRIGIAAGKQLWLDTIGRSVRIRARDLRGVSHRARAAREESPGAAVLVDIHVMIAHDAQAARAAMAQAAPFGNDTLLYVGTPSGLAGLVADIHALGIADGAVLIALRAEGVLDLIHSHVLPELQTMAPPLSPLRGTRSA